MSAESADMGKKAIIRQQTVLFHITELAQSVPYDVRARVEAGQLPCVVTDAGSRTRRTFRNGPGDPNGVTHRTGSEPLPC